MTELLEDMLVDVVALAARIIMMATPQSHQRLCSRLLTETDNVVETILSLDGTSTNHH
jgi:hypothetical protein